MGYWEQIGVENARAAERRARMNPTLRAAKDAGGTAALIAVNLALWAVLLGVPLVTVWQWLAG